MLSLKNIIVGIFLLIQGYWDVRQKSIPTWLSVTVCVIGIIISWMRGRTPVDFFYACLPGILCLCIARLTNEVIGYGDGILLCSLGGMCSLEEILQVCMIASVFGGVAAMVLLVCFHKSGNYEIPFVPFLFIGWLVNVLFLGGI